MAVYGTDLLWGCPQMNFKANPPFNRMKQFFAAFKKRPHGPALARPKGHNENCCKIIRLIPLSITGKLEYYVKLVVYK